MIRSLGVRLALGPAALCCLVELAGAQRAAPPDLVIAGVTVIDVESGVLRRDRTVLIRDGRIASVADRGAPLPRGIQRMDGTGQYLIPGLWDMHVHLSWTTRSALPVLIANGVTGVRDLGSDFTDIVEWRTQIADGAVLGPRIVAAGPILNGRSFNRYQLATGDSAQARGVVRTLKQMGVDLIKVHRRVERSAYFAIADETRKQGLQLVGHIPLTIRPEEASDAGQMIEHTETLFEGTFSTDLPSAALPDSIQRFIDHGGAAALFARFVRNGTSVTPTLAAWRYLIEHPDSSWRSDPHVRYVPCALQEAARRAPLLSAADVPAFRRNFEAYRSIVNRINQAGVRILAGSDVAGVRIPGFSLHDELATLVDAGLTPLQALQSSTANPAAILGRKADFGAIAPGKIADLVVLSGNPLDDIRNTQSITAVIVGGRLLTRRTLDSELYRTAESIRCH
jgi:imidazolonepropionase-like amidohydrolase